MTESRPEFSICLLTYNRRAQLIRRWEELLHIYGANPEVELCILNNGSVDGTEDTLGAWTTKPVPLRFGTPIWRTRLRSIMPNISAGPGFNAVVTMSTGRSSVILADDVRVFGDFLPPIRAVLEVSGGRGLVGQEMVTGPGAWNQFGDNPPIPYIAPHIMGVRREVWDAIGGFDPIFLNLSYEDMDLCYRAVKMGFTLERAAMPVEHLFMSTPRHRETVQNRALFAAKWGLPNVPADIPDGGPDVPR
jgi:GT2 family glycosyltransferase